MEIRENMMSVLNNIDISKEDSWRLKGIALIMMVSMHLMTQEWLRYPDMLWDIEINGNNLSYIITQSVHASSAIFAFITGYAWGGVCNKRLWKLKRIGALYVSYWIISLMVNLPCIWLAGTLKIGSFEDVVLCIAALSSKISPYNWYVSFYAFAVLTFSPVKEIIDNWKCNTYIKIILVIFFFYGIRLIVKTSVSLGFDNLTINHLLSAYGAIMPILIIGYIVHSYNLFTVMDRKMNRVKGVRIECTAALLLSLLSIVKGYLICVLGFKSGLEALWIMIEMYCLLILVKKICRIQYVDILLQWLGKQSLYIWLIHSVFMISNIQKFTYMLHIPVFIIIMVLSLSSLISIPVKYIDKSIQKNICF